MIEHQNQPYLFTDDTGADVLLYCSATEHRTLFFGNDYQVLPWKVMVKVGDKVFRPPLPTHHPEHGEIVIECNPHVGVVDGSPVFYYVAGCMKGHGSPICYYLCAVPTTWSLLEFGDLQTLQKTFTGAVIGGKVTYTEKTASGDVVVAGSDDLGSHPDLNSIYRICPVYGSDECIITGSTPEGPRSFLTSSDLKHCRELVSDSGKGLYKCTILKGRVVYTNKDHPVARSLSEQEVRHKTKKPIGIAWRNKGKKPPGPSTMARSLGKSLIDEAKAVASKTPPVEQSEQDRRMNLCAVCDLFDAKHGRCSECGCVMRFKSKLRSAHCPVGKW